MKAMPGFATVILKVSKCIYTQKGPKFLRMMDTGQEKINTDINKKKENWSISDIKCEEQILVQPPVVKLLPLQVPANFGVLHGFGVGRLVYPPHSLDM